MLFLVLLGAFAIAIPVFNLLVPSGSALHVSTYFVALFGKYVCYGLLALSIDLIWGYVGILSLGHGAFFALGGYAMGMYLMRQIGTRGVYANPILPDFMVFLNWPELPVYWYGFNYFAYAALMVVLVPGVLAFVFGWFAFRSRVTGVYLSIITQALTFALLLGFFRNNFGFGGNNGLTDFKDILGFNVQAEATRNALLVISCLALAIGFLICRAIVTSKFGKVLIAIRDAEARTRFLGYRVEAYKLFVFTLSACMAGVAGALYVPQVGIINPSEFAPGNSIEAVIWVAVGGRGTLTGAVLGAFVVNYTKTFFTSGVLAPYWLFVLGGMFVGVTLLLPRGIIGTLKWGLDRRRAARRWRPKRAPTASRKSEPATPRRARPNRGMRDGKAHHLRLALSRRHQRVVRRLQGAQRIVVRRRAGRDARHHRPERGRQDHHDGRDHRQDAARLRRRLFRGRHLRPLQARRDRNRRARHRPQIPEADRVRDAHGRGQSAAGVEERPPRARHFAVAVLGWRRNSASTRCSTSSGSRRCARAWRAACRTGRSNGWRSACCWRRSRNCCWWTSRSPA